MSGQEIVGLVLALLLMLVGVAGSILPGLPGTPLVFAAAVAHRLYFGEHGAATWNWSELNSDEGMQKEFGGLPGFSDASLSQRRLRRC